MRYHAAVNFLHESPEKQLHEAEKGCCRQETFTTDSCAEVELTQDRYVCFRQQIWRGRAILSLHWIMSYRIWCLPFWILVLVWATIISTISLFLCFLIVIYILYTIILIVWKNMKFTLSFITNGVIIKNLFEVILSFGLLYNIETEKDMGIIFLKLDSAFCIAWQTYGG